MKRIAALFVALLVALTMTASVAAIQPVMTFSDEGTFGPKAAGTFTNCGFPVQWGGWFQEYKRVWFDDDDLPVKAEVSFQGTATYFNAEADWMTVSEQWSWKIHEDDFRIEGDALVWDQRLTGKEWGIKLPRGGPIVHVTGQTVGVGSWVWGEPEPTATWLAHVGRALWDDEAFCDALTPPAE